MKVLVYNELNPKAIPGFAKLQSYLEDDDFFCVRPVVSMKIKSRSYISPMKPVTKHWFILTPAIIHLTCWIKSSPLMTGNSRFMTCNRR